MQVDQSNMSLTKACLNEKSQRKQLEYCQARNDLLDRIWNRFNERLGLVKETIRALTQDLDKFYIQWKFESNHEVGADDTSDFSSNDLNFFKSMIGNISKPCEQMLHRLSQKHSLNSERLLKMSQVIPPMQLQQMAEHFQIEDKGMVQENGKKMRKKQKKKKEEHDHEKDQDEEDLLLESCIIANQTWPNRVHMAINSIRRLTHVPKKGYNYMLKTGLIEWPSGEEMLNMAHPSEWLLKKVCFYQTKADLTNENCSPFKKRKGVQVESNNYKSSIYSYETGEVCHESSYSFELAENERIKHVDTCKRCWECIFFDEDKLEIATLKSSYDHSFCPKEALASYTLREGEVVLGFGLVFIGVDLQDQISLQEAALKGI